MATCFNEPAKIHGIECNEAEDSVVAILLELLNKFDVDSRKRFIGSIRHQLSDGRCAMQYDIDVYLSTVVDVMNIMRPSISVDSVFGLRSYSRVAHPSAIMGDPVAPGNNEIMVTINATEERQNKQYSYMDDSYTKPYSYSYHTEPYKITYTKCFCVTQEDFDEAMNLYKWRFL